MSRNQGTILRGRSIPGRRRDLKESEGNPFLVGKYNSHSGRGAIDH